MVVGNDSESSVVFFGDCDPLLGDFVSAGELDESVFFGSGDFTRDLGPPSLGGDSLRLLDDSRRDLRFFDRSRCRLSSLVVVVSLFLIFLVAS